MAKTYIGIDLDGNRLRVVAVEEEGAELKPSVLVRRDLDTPGDAADAVAAILGEQEMSNARMAMALPAVDILTRPLSFPFGDRKKIAAIAPLELGARLPIDLSGYHVTSLPPVRRGDVHQTFGLALPEELIASTLAPYDALQLPLRTLGAAPFAFVGQLAGQPDDCILTLLRDDHVATLAVRDDEPAGIRIASRAGSLSADETAAQIVRDALALARAEGLDDCPVLLLGTGLEDELLEKIRAVLPAAAVPDEPFEDGQVPPEYLPALALARLASAPGRSLNLRQGTYAFRGSLAPFRRQLVAAAVLACLTLLALGGSGWLAYNRKAQTSNQLQSMMQTAYKQSFPQVSEVPKDIPLHMTSRLNEARRQSRLLGSPGTTPLVALEAVTRSLPEGSETVIREFVYDKDGIRLSGRARSFDEVDKLAATLNKVPEFATARISDAKTSLDGKRVDFRVEFGFAEREGQ